MNIFAGDPVSGDIDALMDETRSHARAQGISYLKIQLSAHNTDALNFYRK